MRRLLLLLSALSLCLLAYGTAYYPDFAAFWLASGGVATQTIRFLLAGVLLVQFATRPPRNMYFRMLCGAVAIVAAGWALEETYAYRMLFLDTLSILAASIATGITALEINYDKEVIKTSKFTFVTR